MHMIKTLVRMLKKRKQMQMLGYQIKNRKGMAALGNGAVYAR